MRVKSPMTDCKELKVSNAQIDKINKKTFWLANENLKK